jgi:hypothetical protein
MPPLPPPSDMGTADYLRRLALIVGPTYPYLEPVSPWAETLWDKDQLSQARRLLAASRRALHPHRTSQP